MTPPGAITSWWSGLESREQRMLLAGAVFVIAAGLYTLVYPVFSMYSAASNEVAAADRDYRWLEEQVRILTEVRDAAGGVLPVSMPLALVKGKIESDLEGREIEARVEIENTGTAERVRISVERVQGKSLMSWLEELANNGYVIAEIKLRNNGSLLTGTIAVGT